MNGVRHSDEGPQCPYCGMQATADEACYYSMTEFDCDDCGERSSVSVDTVTTWRTERSSHASKLQEEQMIEQIVSALQNADLHDGDDHYRLFDLLGYSGDNKFVMITRQLATAAHSVMAGKVAELEAALRLFIDDERFQVTMGGNPSAVEAAIAQAHAALAPHPKPNE